MQFMTVFYGIVLLKCVPAELSLGIYWEEEPRDRETILTTNSMSQTRTSHTDPLLTFHPLPKPFE